MSYLSPNKKEEYSRLWKMVNIVEEPSTADDKAGYPPNCNEGYEEKDGKCVPTKRAKEESPQKWKKKDNNAANATSAEEAACTLTQEQAVIISSKISEVLQDVVKQFNSQNKKRVTLDKIKATYREGARIYKKTEKAEFNINTWAFANVNLFLSTYLVKSEESILSDFFAKATEDIKKYDVDVQYDSIDQLYLEAYSPIQCRW
jgi:hypothetical protein